MQLTVDTRNATQFELTSLAELMQKLAGTAPLVYQGTIEGPRHAVQTFDNLPKNDNPDNNLAPPIPDAPVVGNDAHTAIPPVPANATGSESQSNAPAGQSDTPATGAGAAPEVPSDQKLDSAGFPWDSRINTANKGTIGDGTWRKKPGVDPALVEQVRAELRAGATPRTDAPAIPNVPANTGASTDAPNLPSAALAAPTLSAADVLARCTEIQMANAAKGAALYQAIIGAGVAGGPMALTGVTDPAILVACLDAVNAVGAA